MLVSTLALTMGLVFLAAARLSGNPTGYGFVVFVGYLFVAIACAMHLSAVLDRLIGPEAVLRRVSTKAVAWLAVGGGTAWLIGRTPSEEVLFALLLAPPAVGIAGLLAARDNRWSAISFLVVAGLLAALVILVWLARQAR